MEGVSLGLTNLDIEPFLPLLPEELPPPVPANLGSVVLPVVYEDSAVREENLGECHFRSPSLLGAAHCASIPGGSHLATQGWGLVPSPSESWKPLPS